MFVEAFRTPLLTFHNQKDTPLWQSDVLVSFSTLAGMALHNREGLLKHFLLYASYLEVRVTLFSSRSSGSVHSRAGGLSAL